MKLCESVYRYLAENKVACGRIYPYVMPQNGSYPGVVYSVVSTKYDSALTKDTGYTRCVLQFNCYDVTFAKVSALSASVRRLLQDYSGELFGVDIQATFVRSDFITQTKGLNRAETEVYCGVLEILFHYLDGEKEEK